MLLTTRSRRDGHLWLLRRARDHKTLVLFQMCARGRIGIVVVIVGAGNVVVAPLLLSTAAGAFFENGGRRRFVLSRR